jgi:hypothetical protein
MPINSANDMNFTREKMKVTPEFLASAQSKIIAAL